MKIRRGTTLGILVVALCMIGGRFAFAANPTTSWDGCMKAYTPYTVVSGANTIMRAESYNAGCIGGSFRNCLERSSWSGYVTLKCNAWHLVSEVHTQKVSGCLKGTYDYHTRNQYQASWGSYGSFTSEARKAYKCLVTI